MSTKHEIRIIGDPFPEYVRAHMPDFLPHYLLVRWFSQAYGHCVRYIPEWYVWIVPNVYAGEGKFEADIQGVRVRELICTLIGKYLEEMRQNNMPELFQRDAERVMLNKEYVEAVLCALETNVDCCVRLRELFLDGHGGLPSDKMHELEFSREAVKPIESLPSESW